MKLDIDIIKAPIDKELNEFDRQFKDAMKSSVPLLDIITRYIVKRKGKQIRPMFVFFSAELCGGIKDATYRLQLLLNCFTLQRWCMTTWWMIRQPDAGSHPSTPSGKTRWLS